MITTMRMWAITKASRYKIVLSWAKTIWVMIRSMKEVRHNTRRSTSQSTRIRMRRKICKLIVIWVHSIIKVSLLDSLAMEAKLIQVTSLATKHANKSAPAFEREWDTSRKAAGLTPDLMTERQLWTLTKEMSGKRKRNWKWEPQRMKSESWCLDEARVEDESKLEGTEHRRSWQPEEVNENENKENRWRAWGYDSDLAIPKQKREKQREHTRCKNGFFHWIPNKIHMKNRGHRPPSLIWLLEWKFVRGTLTVI
jgi:hypothetical protein